MKSIVRNSVVAAAALAVASVVSVGSASAETIVRAVYHFDLMDKAGGSKLITSRLSVRSWPNMDQCKVQAPKGEGFHTRAVEGFGIKNAAGDALEVKMSKVSCFVVSE